MYPQKMHCLSKINNESKRFQSKQEKSCENVPIKTDEWARMQNMFKCI